MKPGLASNGWPLIVVGAFLLLGYLAHVAGRRTHVPRVTLLLVLGVLLGPSGVGLIPTSVRAWFPVATQIALSMVGFILGERLLGKRIRRAGRVVLIVALTESLGAAVFVALALLAVGTPPVLALLLGGLAPASAPAATLDVIRESRASGKMTDIVTGVVALDDAYGIILFSLVLVVTEAVSGGTLSWAVAGAGLWEIGGALALGAVMGVPMAWLTGRIRPGELTLVEAMGFVLLCGGIAIAIGVSYLLAGIALGAVVSARARHHERPLHAIEGISQPFLVVFFLLAGMEFDLSQLDSLGLIGATYVVARTAGKLAGGFAGAHLTGTTPTIRKYVGLCFLPQAGVALGLGLVAAQHFVEMGAGIISLLIGTTFVFEVLGPPVTRYALRRAGETREQATRRPRKRSHEPR